MQQALCGFGRAFRVKYVNIVLGMIDVSICFEDKIVSPKQILALKVTKSERGSDRYQLLIVLNDCRIESK
jgi:hypothetical protein